MFAKQTVLSASLVAWLVGATSARADPEPSTAPAGEVRPDDTTNEAATPVESPGMVAPTPPPAATPPPASPAVAPPPPPRLPSPPQEAATGRFSLGAGFSSDEAFIATAEVAQEDLFHTGLQLSLSARISALQQRFVLRFVDPAVLGSGWAFSTEVYNDRRVLPGLDREATGTTLALSHAIGAHTRGFIGYRIEEVTAQDMLQAVARGEALPPLGGGLLSALRGGVEWSTVDAMEHRGADGGIDRGRRSPARLR
jgi:hypothetical protein